MLNHLKGLGYFQTIESILKPTLMDLYRQPNYAFPDYWVYFKAKNDLMSYYYCNLDFQTIESILKLEENRDHYRHICRFPDYWVYFKAIFVIWSHP